MNVLLQKNIWGEYAYNTFCASLDTFGAKSEFVEVIPFTDQFAQDINFIPDVVFGSTRFVNICRSKGLPTFASFNPIEPAWIPLNYWINNNGYTSRFGDIKIDSPKFLKPFKEKFFTGVLVESQDDLSKIQLSTSFIDNENDELVWVTDPQIIETEVRFFVLHGSIISGSIYKINGIGNYSKVNYCHPAWSACQNIISNSNIKSNIGFVIDLGWVNGDWKVVELNNLNSSGFYKCDTDAIVRALMQIYKK